MRGFIGSQRVENPPPYKPPHPFFFPDDETEVKQYLRTIQPQQPPSPPLVPPRTLSFDGYAAVYGTNNCDTGDNLDPLVMSALVPGAVVQPDLILQPTPPHPPLKE